MKRLYSRATMLTSAVVFGGIAIAQAQKDLSDVPRPQAEVPATVIAEARPIPIHDAPSDAGLFESASTPVVTSANAELPADEPGPEPFAAEAGAWAADPPVDSLSGEVVVDTYPVDQVEGGESEPAPMLPDPVAFPEDTPPSPIPTRSNPYRSPQPDSASVYGDLTNQDPLEEELPQTEIALPDVDATALPASRNEVIDGEAYAAPPQPSVAGQSASEFPEPADSFAYEDAASVSPEPDPRGAPLPEPAAGEFSPVDQGHAPLNPQPASPPGRYADPQPAQVSSDPSPSVYGQSTAPSVSNDPSSPYSAPTATPAVSSFATSEPVRSPNATSMNVAPGDVPSIGKPGPQSLEGPQTPSLTLQKVVPEEIQVGRPAKFGIRVRNIGRVTAENVIIRDEVPEGTNFLDAAPKASRSADGAVYWEAGSLAPGQEVTVSMEVMPVAEGQVGSVATVSFQASASARTRATKPDLALEHTGPLKVLVGEAVQFSIKLSNPGTGAATQVVLEEDVPQGLAHSSGARLEYEVGTIEPGQTRRLELTLKADQPGHVINRIVARADGGLIVEDAVELDVVAPELQVAIEGPSRRYLERQATFTVAVANPGTAAARNVELVAQLPTGLKFVSTNNSGYYDASRHVVIWSLEQLPAGEMGKAQFTAMPVEMGAFQIQAEGRAEMGLVARKEHDLAVEGIAALFFGLADKVDPIEIGGQTTYEIKVVNQGSKAATNVQFVALVPDGMQPTAAQGPTQEAVEGQRVMFAPLDRLAPQEQAVFEITVAGQSAGDHRFRVQMTSDETTTPVIKEESTRVYSD